MKTSAIDYFADGYPSETFRARPAPTIFCLHGDDSPFDSYKYGLERHKCETQTWRFPSKPFKTSLETGGNRFKSCAIGPIVFAAKAAQPVSTVARFGFGLQSDVFSPAQPISTVKHPGYGVEIFIKPFERLRGVVETYFNRIESCAIIPIALSAGGVQLIFGPGCYVSGPGVKRKNAYRRHPGDERNKRNIKRLR